MENSLLFIFGKIWPKSLYYSTGTFTRFWSNFKRIHDNAYMFMLHVQLEALICAHALESVLIL